MEEYFQRALINSFWKLWIGIKGIRVKRKIDAGNNAIRRINAIEDALVTRTPFWKPFKTNLIT